MIKTIHSSKIAFCFLLALIFSMIFSTFSLDNLDDKTAMAAYINHPLFDQSGYLERMNLAEDVANSSNTVIAKHRAFERLSLPYNYLLTTKVSLPLSHWILSKTSLSFSQQVSLSISYGLIVIHGLILILLFYLFIHAPPHHKTILWQLLMGLCVFIACQKGLVFFHNKSDLQWWHQLFLIGHSPIIYVPRGALGLWFMVQCYLFLTQRVNWLMVSMLISPFLHMGQSVFLNIFLMIALLFQMMIDPTHRYHVKSYINIIFKTLPIILGSYWITSTAYIAQKPDPTFWKMMYGWTHYVTDPLTFLRWGLLAVIGWKLLHKKKQHGSQVPCLFLGITLLLEGLIGLTSGLFATETLSSYTEIIDRVMGSCIVVILTLLWIGFIQEKCKIWLLSIPPIFKKLAIGSSLVVMLLGSIVSAPYLHKKFILEPIQISRELHPYFETKQDYTWLVKHFSQKPLSLDDEVLYHLYLGYQFGQFNE